MRRKISHLLYCRCAPAPAAEDWVLRELAWPLENPNSLWVLVSLATYSRSICILPQHLTCRCRLQIVSESSQHVAQFRAGMELLCLVFSHLTCSLLGWAVCPGFPHSTHSFLCWWRALFCGYRRDCKQGTESKEAITSLWGGHEEAQECGA